MKRDAMRELLIGEAEGVTESPIEALLFTTILYQIGFEMYERASMRRGETVTASYELEAQQVCEGFRIDMVLIGSLGGAKIAIECDGHAFHERTKEQASRDKSRDRTLATNGFRVLRFSGSEIWRNPIKCAREVLSVAAEMESNAAEIAYRASSGAKD